MTPDSKSFRKWKNIRTPLKELYVIQWNTKRNSQWFDNETDGRILE